jgi:hypothetical protein
MTLFWPMVGAAELIAVEVIVISLFVAALMFTVWLFGDRLARR